MTEVSRRAMLTAMAGTSRAAGGPGGAARWLTSPVMLVRGEHDGIATEEDLLEFDRRLPNPDRQFVVLAGASHAVALGLTRNQFRHVLRAFLTMPSAVGA
jgi:pimeloyl-ACP methyl ester carboxylesterase